MLSLSKSQQSANDKILDWFKTSAKRPYLTLGGYAGTGKTTLISHIRNELNKDYPDLRVAFCSYTGKASRVLRNKIHDSIAIYPKDTISTIHSLIYSPIESDKGIITGWELKDDIKADLIVIDEASMVDEEIWRDLCAFDKPILAVGDHGQLPPIKGSLNLMKNPDIKLEEIQRQAEDNPIIKISLYARRFGYIPVKDYGQGVKKFSLKDEGSRDYMEEFLRAYNNETLILCGFNKTRVNLNKFIRQALEFYSPTPLTSDRVICLRNNHEKLIYNGMLGVITNIKDKNEKWYEATIEMDDGELFEGPVAKDQFGYPESFNFTEHRAKYLEGDLFDFGYALTVHKAQGSEAKRVILLEEKSSKMDHEMWRRWLYTAVTRAQEELYIFG